MGATMQEDRFGLAFPSLAPGAVAPNTTAEQTFTVPGLKVNDFVALAKPTLNAGAGIVNCRVSAADTLAVSYVNATSATVTPTTQVHALFWFRSEHAPNPPVVNP